jgi:hypothetical protein
MLNVNEIPSSIEILGHEIKIVYDNATCKEKMALGFADLHHNRIVLTTLDPHTDLPMPPSIVYHTFLHEVTHFMLDFMGDKKGEDEKFVDLMGGMIYQIIKTARYAG